MYEMNIDFIVNISYFNLNLDNNRGNRGNRVLKLQVYKSVDISVTDDKNPKVDFLNSITYGK